MAQTSIHIVPVKAGSDVHNARAKELDYVRKELTHDNETFIPEEFQGISLEQLAESIKEDYSAAHGKKLHARATPVREAVTVIGPDTTMKQLRDFCSACQEKWGITAVRIYTHKDEGHTDEEGVWKPNLHAHIVFDWYDRNTHTTVKLSKYDMCEMQTLLAECLSMERGISSDKKHLNALQQKNKAEAEKIERLQHRLDELQKQHTEALIKECKDLRKSGTQAVKCFDYVVGLKATAPTEDEKRYRDGLDAECRKDIPASVDDLSTHALRLRAYLMNTLSGVRRMGEAVQKAAKNVKFWKRNRIEHEAALEARVEAAEKKAKEITREAEKAIKNAENSQERARLAIASAEKRENNASIQIKGVELAKKNAYEEGKKDKDNEWREVWRVNAAPVLKEHPTLLQQIDELKLSLQHELNAHTRQAVETAKMLIRTFGAEPFEKKDVPIVHLPSWEAAKKEILKEDNAIKPERFFEGIRHHM